jgi:hypothetical protein
MNILAMAKSLTELELKQLNTNVLLGTQIGLESKFFQFALSTIIACFGAENRQKHGYRGGQSFSGGKCTQWQLVNFF